MTLYTMSAFLRWHLRLYTIKDCTGGFTQILVDLHIHSSSCSSRSVHRNVISAAVLWLESGRQA